MHSELSLRPSPHQYYDVSVKPPIPLPPQDTASLNFAKFIQQKAAAVSVDINNDEYYTYWGGQPLDTWATTFGHLLRQVANTITAPSEYDSLELFAVSALAQLQRRAVQALRTDVYGLDRENATPEEIIAHAKTFDLIMNDEFHYRTSRAPS